MIIYRQVSVAVLLVAVLTFCVPSQAKQYQIAAQNDFDSFKEQKYKAGDEILFKRGAVFKGMFTVSGSGTADAPIRVGVYGDGDTRPVINAGGVNQAGLLVYNSAYIEVDGLEITNTNGSDEDQGELFGIYVLVQRKENTTIEHTYINDCYIHDVNGKVAGKRRGGIHVHVIKCKDTKFNDLRITNNRISYVGGVGIGNSSKCSGVDIEKGKEVVTRNLWTNVYVADNYVEHTGRNNIIARVSKDAIYERNILAHSSRYDTGHSIFCFDTDGIKIQYNEAYGNVGDMENKDGGGEADRGGFDADYNCINTYIQYNYSHDNMWFCGIMKRPNSNIIIRYNISQNDLSGIYFYGFNNKKDAKGIHIYNNTHFVRKGLEVEVFVEGRTPLNTTFENNIFCFEGEGEWGEDPKGRNLAFNRNVYCNIEAHPTDRRGIGGRKVGFINPGQAGTDIDLSTMKALEGYRLDPRSMLNKGALPIEDNGGQNLFGEKLPEGTHRFGAL